MTEEEEAATHLCETFDILAERLDRVIPDAAREAFDGWRDITTFILNHKGPLPPLALKQATDCMAEIVAISKSANITILP